MQDTDFDKLPTTEVISFRREPKATVIITNTKGKPVTDDDVLDMEAEMNSVLNNKNHCVRVHLHDG